MHPPRLLACLGALLVLAALTLTVQPTHAYVEAPMSLGSVLAQSTNVVLALRVERVDKEKNLIIYRKVKDLKGQGSPDVFKHNIGRAGLRPDEWKPPMEWAEPGKSAVIFYNGGACETCIGTWWYQVHQGGDWWVHAHGEPFLLRSFAGQIDKLAAAVTAMVDNKEAIVPCMVDGDKEDLHKRRAKIQRVKVSLKLQDYNPKRDFVGWGGDDFRRLQGMPGFTHLSALARVDPEALGISCVDIDGDGKMDLCLVGAGKIAVLHNSGESLSEVSLPSATGCRAAVWADYNGDGKPDLLLATATGPKLFTNLGNLAFRDDSALLPQGEPMSLTCAAWIDQNGDGKPDILLGNGYHGLRLYRNVGQKTKQPVAAAPKLGKWHYLGPLDNAGGKGFEQGHAVEQGVDLKKTYEGKGGEKAKWRAGNFNDGAVNNLALFKPQFNSWSAVYLHRTIEANVDMELPVSLGSDDTLTVWLNGKKLLAVNEYRGCAPDQNHVTLPLQKGTNHLLMKVCQGDGEWSFYFKAGQFGPLPPREPQFVDVSAEVGLGPDGIGANVKGDTLTVCDVNNDGRADFLYGAGTGVLVLNTPAGFVEAKDHGIAYRPGGVGPIFGDFDGDGHPDLFIPQQGRSLLFKNDGTGRFTDVTDKSGDLAKLSGWATSAAWGDVDNDGLLDLVIGCLRGPNRYLRNKGDGTFEDCTAKLGLDQRVFNTQGVCLVDLNNDGMLDFVFNNEGQDSCVLLGNPELKGKRTPVTLTIAGAEGVIGCQVRVLDKQGKAHGVQHLSGGDGRGGQSALEARFALEPGEYRVEVRGSNGAVRSQEIVVAGTPMRVRVGEQPGK